MRITLALKAIISPDFARQDITEYRSPIYCMHTRFYSLKQIFESYLICKISYFITPVHLGPIGLYTIIQDLTKILYFRQVHLISLISSLILCD